MGDLASPFLRSYGLAASHLHGLISFWYKQTMTLSPLYGTLSRETFSKHDLDLSTCANYLEIRTKHIDLEWSIDWSKQVIHGSCTLRMEVIAASGVEYVSLDGRYLEITRVQDQDKDLKYVLGDRDCVCGRKLTIQLGRPIKRGEVSLLHQIQSEEAHAMRPERANQNYLLHHQGLYSSGVAQPRADKERNVSVHV